ncbi:MAG: hypothetical protein H7175_28610 [Burkholderiales bacterium]|nr:hypothetical protein [Anaerolineae bacterium]
MIVNYSANVMILFDEINAKGVGLNVHRESAGKAAVNANNRGSNGWILAVLVIVIVALFSPVVFQMVVLDTDYDNHIEDAEALVETGSMTRPRPNFLNELLIIGIHALLPGVDFWSAGFVVALVFYALLGVVLYWPLRAALGEGWGAPAAAAALALSLMLIAPITLPYWSEQSLYYGYVVPHPYHNPSTVILKPLAVLQFLYAVRIFESADKRRWRRTLLICAAITLAASIAKASYTLALLPTLGILWLIYDRELLRKIIARVGARYVVPLQMTSKIDWRLMVFGVFVPAILVLAWQYLFFFSLRLLLGIDGGGGGNTIVFRPFGWHGLQGDGLLPKFLLSIAFPLAVYALYFRQARHGLWFNLSWLAFAISVFYAYFIGDLRGGRFGGYVGR